MTGALALLYESFWSYITGSSQPMSKQWQTMSNQCQTMSKQCQTHFKQCLNYVSGIRNNKSHPLPYMNTA